MALRSLTTVELRRELERRERGADKLLAKHKALSARLADIHAELADLGVDGMEPRRGPGRPAGRRGPGRPAGRRGPGRPPKAGRRARAKNEMSLRAALAKAVRVGSTVSPAEAGAAVKKLGYASTSRTFGIQVASTLSKSSDFKKTGRGQYLRKGGASAPPAKRGPKPKVGRKTRKAGKRGRKPGRPKGSGKKNAKPATPPAAAASAS